MYDQYLQNMIYLNSQLAETLNDGREKGALQKEIIELTIKLQQHTKDPYIYYNIGKLFLAVQDEKQAADYFQLAAEKSPDNAFYKEPARKLAERLRK
jgi:uncharacterized protein HemY